jgi:transposase-like protein
MMGKLRDKDSTMAAARRGQIVQRVLVDGWSVRQAASTFGIDERCVARWVSAYRRRGMASLRCDDTAPERAYRRLAKVLQLLLPQAFGSMRQLIGRSPPAPCVVLRRSRDDALRR